ncbi:MAG: methyltransferase domain-containing protein [Burkholderiales bacterium]
MTSNNDTDAEIARPAGTKLEMRSARRAFDRAAGRANFRCDLADEIASRMAERLNFLRIQPSWILDASLAPARKRLLAGRYPSAKTLTIAMTPRIANLSAVNKNLLSRIRRSFGMESDPTICGELSSLPLIDASVDMIWSNLSLAWATDIGAAFSECHRVLVDGGLLMFSTYGPDTLRELKEAFNNCDERPHVHEFADMHDLGDQLVARGFADPVMDMDKIVYSYGDVETLIDDQRRSGQINVMANRARGLTGRAAWSRMLSAYPKQSDSGRIEATFEIVYGHAWKIGTKSRAKKSHGANEPIQWLPTRPKKI